MAKQDRLDSLYIDTAIRVAEMSYARRTKVGAVIVKGDNQISMGWNGMPSGMDNNCEIENADGTLTTKTETLHAESNALMKLAKTGGVGAEGATLYVTLSPCVECAKLIKQSGISRVVYKDDYRIGDGVGFLKKLGIIVDKL